MKKFKKFIGLLVVCFIINTMFVYTLFGADTNVVVNINSTFIDLQNLYVRYNSTTPNTKIDISWNNLIVGTTQTQQTSILTLDATTIGVNGLDTGSLANNTWYYLYAIHNGNTVASLLSISSTNPTMPSGYTNKRLISSFLTNNSAYFYKQVQFGDFVYYIVDGGTFRVISNGTASTFTTLSLGSYGVPPITQKVKVSIQVNPIHNTAGVYFPIGIRPTGSGLTYGYGPVATISQVANIQVFGSCEINVFTNNNQQIDYKFFTSPSSGGGFNLDVLGYYLSL